MSKSSCFHAIFSAVFDYSYFFLFLNYSLGYYSPRIGDFQTATVKNAMKIVATAQMVRSFMCKAPCSILVAYLGLPGMNAASPWTTH